MVLLLHVKFAGVQGVLRDDALSRMFIYCDSGMEEINFSDSRKTFFIRGAGLREMNVRGL